MKSIWFRVLRRIKEEVDGLPRRALILKYRLLCKIGTRRVLHAESQPNLIVSLTTFPPRLHSVHLTIESLLRQEMMPDRLILWLSEAEISRDQITKSLRRQQKRGLEIRFVAGNVRSYKKLIYAGREFPGADIVTADDDVLYPRNWLRRLFEASRESPGSVVCFRGAMISFDAAGARRSYKDWSHTDGGNRPSLLLFPIGVSGVLYPRGSIVQDFLNADMFMRLCPTGDDIWFKAMTLKNELRCRRVLTENIHFPTLPGSQTVSLHRINNLEGQNDQQIHAVFEFFGLNEVLLNATDSESDKSERNQR